MPDLIPASETVVLANSGTPISIQSDRVYFPFPSGRLAYDCVTCGAQCCKGHGYDVFVDRELKSQLGTAHALRFFLDPCSSGATDHFHTRNLKPGCFFLTEQKSCGIQVKHGYDAKPETCRLFPFNYFTRMGDYLIVAPHTGLCPLAVLPPGERSPASSHDELLAEIVATGISTHVTHASTGDLDVAQLVALERRIVDLADADPPVTRYAVHAAAQLALTRVPSISQAATAAVHEQAIEHVDGFLTLVYEVLGAEQPSGDDRDQALVRTMVCMTPAIRSRLVFGEGAAFQPDGLERMPFLLLALHTFATFASEAGMAQVTYQSVMSLFDSYRSLLRLLANVDRVLAWTPDAVVDFVFTGSKTMQASYLGVAKALVRQTQRTAPLTLGRILCDHGIADDMDRILFLKQLAPRLDGRLAPMSTPLAGGPGLREPRAAMRRWALQHLSPDMLMYVADRQSKKAARK